MQYGLRAFLGTRQAMTGKDEKDDKRRASNSAAAIDDIPETELTPSVRKALFPMRAEVERLRVELSAAQSQITELQTLANQDPLLGLYNRRAFMRELERSVAMAERHAVQACLVFVDVNGLKAINDGMGHRYGDAALKHVAVMLSEHVRQTDIVGRLGGDEFGLILTHTSKTLAESKVERLASLIRQKPVAMEEDEFQVGVSFGVATIDKGARVEQLIDLADQAMYERKRNDQLSNNVRQH